MHNTDGFALSPEELKRKQSREYEFEKESDALAKWLVEGNELNDDIFDEVYTVSSELCKKKATRPCLGCKRQCRSRGILVQAIDCYTITSATRKQSEKCRKDGNNS